MSARKTGLRIRRPAPPVATPEREPSDSTLDVGGELNPTLAARVRAQQGGGAPLEPATEGRLGNRLNHNFADVRVHADDEAARLNRDLRANAFTLGRDVFLGQQAARGAPSDALLAHELTHVVQQRGAAQDGPLRLAPAHDAREQQATAASLGTPLAGAAAPLGRALIQRDPHPDPKGGIGASVVGAVANALTTVGAVLTDPVNAATGYHGAVDVAEWHEHHEAGPIPASASRNPTYAYIGDKYTIEAKISGEAAEQIETLSTSETIVPVDERPGSKFTIEHAVRGKDTLVWTIIPTTPGHQHIALGVCDALGQNGDYYDLDIAAGADPTWFKGRCSTAESKLNTLYATGQAWFYDCFTNYIAGYNAFDAALKAQSSADKLVGELLLGALFAVAGGAIGGAVGGALTPMMKDVEEGGKIIFQGLSSATKGAITDSAKDLTKWVVRLPPALKDKVLGSHGGGAPADAQASTDPSKAGVDRGAGAVAAIDPLQWFALLQHAINAERAEAGQILTNLHESIDEFSITDPMQVWDWDPEQTIMDAARLDGKPLDQLGKVPEAVAYERSMWEVWLSHYSWKVLQQYGMAGNTELVISGVGGKLKDEIDRVAAKFGESGDDWIARYGGPLKAKLDAEADKANRAAHPWVYGTADLVDSLAKRATTP